MFNVFLLIIGFWLLIKGADLFVEGSASLAKRLGVSGLVIGLTVVAFGTSAPELLVSVLASLKGVSEIAVGNVLGSNVANILLILGVSSLIYPLAVTKGTVWKEIPFSLLAVLVLGAFANDVFFDKAAKSVLSRVDGFIFICFFVIFIYYVVSIAPGKRSSASPETPLPGTRRSLLLLGSGFGVLMFGANLVVNKAVAIALNLGMSREFIGLTIVALGTSLPELAASVTAACKKSPDIAVGNVIGSNIFNIFFVLGVSAMIRPLPLGLNVNADILVLIAISLLLFIFMITGKSRRLEKWHGAVFVVLYVTYLVFLVKRG